MRAVRTSRPAHLIIVESKEFLSQLVLMLSIPLIGQKLLDCITAFDKDIAVSPDGVGSVGHFDFGWISFAELLAIFFLVETQFLTGCSIHLAQPSP